MLSNMAFPHLRFSRYARGHPSISDTIEHRVTANSPFSLATIGEVRAGGGNGETIGVLAGGGGRRGSFRRTAGRCGGARAEAGRAVDRPGAAVSGTARQAQTR